MYNIDENFAIHDILRKRRDLMLKIGCHVGMSGKEMFLGSVKEAISYGANTFMVYTGAPQNTKRKPLSDLRIEEAKALMKEHHIEDFVIHAPYIINLGNSTTPQTFELAVDFLRLEIERSAAMGSNNIVLHPGSHVKAGTDIGVAQIIKGLNEVLTPDTPVHIALETMAGKGSEVGRNFEEIARIYEGVTHNDKLRVCFDTCHTNDAGYDLVHEFDCVMEQFDQIIGKEQISVFHINDSKNPLGAGKDRHENIGFGYIGFDALRYIVTHPDFENIPKILETPYIPHPENKKKSFAPYKHEIEMLRTGIFNPKLKEQILKEKL